MIKSLKRFKQSLRRVHFVLDSRLKAVRTDLRYKWIQARCGPPLPIDDGRTIVFAPHQDDETLGCGGLIALKCQQQAPLRVVFLTDGRQSHGRHAGGAHLNDVRREEAATALSILGVGEDQIDFLDLPDGGLAGLDLPRRRAAIGQIAAVLINFQPAQVFVPYRKDRHRDHEAASALIEAAIDTSGLAIKTIQYPIWYLWEAPRLDLGQRGLKRIRPLPIAPVQQQKRQAIAAYRSQLGSPGSTGVLPPGFLDQFLQPCELFFEP